MRRPPADLTDACAKLAEIERLAGVWRVESTGPSREPNFLAGLAHASNDVRRVLEAPPGYAGVPRENWPAPPEAPEPRSEAVGMRSPALTIHQPWAWAIAGGWKPVENRDWPPPRWLFGRYLAIHAGRQYDGPAARELVRHREALGLPAGPPDGNSIARGAIVAAARIAGAVQVERDDEDPAVPRLRFVKVLGDVSEQTARELAASPWASGPWLWVLQGVVAVDPPIPCRGLQKLWSVPAPIAEQVRQHIKARRAA